MIRQISHATSRLQAKVESRPHKKKKGVHLSIVKTLVPFNYIIAKFGYALYSMLLQVRAERHGPEAKIAFNAIQVGGVIKGEESHSSSG